MDDFGNLSDEELLSMGQKAGYLPASPDAVSGADPASPNLPPPAESPMRQGLTPPSVQLSSPDAGMVSPGSSYGMNQSYHGFSDPAFNRVSKHDDSLTRDFRNADAEAAVGAQRDAAIAKGPRADMIDAEKAKAQAVVGQIHQTGENALVMQRLQDGFAAEEAKINAESSHLANQAKADYLAALNDFRAARVDPSQLWGNMNGGQKIGMLATAFVHDFLGVKGIHTSAMDTFNKAIDRNIDSQIQAIKTKGDVAEGFKSLWEMQRAQSASDTEARTRVRGFLLEGAKQQVIANMTQYESALASAQGQAAVAKIDEELSKTLIDVYRHSDTNALQLRQQALEKWKTKINASLESQSLGLKAQELQLQRDKANKENQVQLEPIYDPETGEPKWVYNPHLKLSEPERANVRTQFQATDEVNQNLNKLRELARKGSVFDPIAGTRLAGTDAQEFNALAKRVAHGMIKAFGEKATDADVADMITGFRPDTWLNQADAEKVIASTQKELLDNNSTLVHTYGMDLPPEARAQFGKSGTGTAFEASVIDAKNTISPPPKGQEELLRETAGKYLSSEDSDKNIAGDDDELTYGIKDVKSSFLKAHPEFARSAQDKSAGEQFSERVGETKPEVITQHDKGLMMLARGAEGGDKKAFAELQEQANSYIIGKQTDEDSVFAAYLMEMINPGSTSEDNKYNYPVTEPKDR